MREKNDGNNTEIKRGRAKTKVKDVIERIAELKWS